MKPFTEGGDFLSENIDEEKFEAPEDWIEETPKEDHRVISRALENPLRRKIMKFIGLKSEKNLQEISEKFDLHESEAKTHLNFLEDAEIVEKIDDAPTFRLDEIGRKYLENVEKVNE